MEVLSSHFFLFPRLRGAKEKSDNCVLFSSCGAKENANYNIVSWLTCGRNPYIFYILILNAIFRINTTFS